MSYLKQYISGRGYSIAMEDVELQMEQLTMADSPPVKPVSYVTWKYHTDPEFKEKYIQQRVEQQKKKFERDPESYELHKQRVNERNKERYRNDPEYREYLLRKSKEYREKKKQAKLLNTCV